MANESFATIDYTQAKNGQGYMNDCVYATCDETGDKVGPVWGSGPRSVKRALCLLSEDCSCGARWHNLEDPDDMPEEPAPRQRQQTPQPQQPQQPQREQREQFQPPTDQSWPE